MLKQPDNRIFGKRAEPHVLILARGDKIRHMTVRPWMGALSICTIAVACIGYLGATSYLVFRDDLIGATMARQARMQHDYEDRISALRAQVDRVTSRQLLDQQVVEKKVEKLLQQQMALSSRHGRIDTLLSRAESSGVVPPEAPPLPVNALVPERRAELSSGHRAIDALLGDGALDDASPDNPPLAYGPAASTVADRADRLFSRLTLSLKNIENDQFMRIRGLTDGASETAQAIEGIMRENGVDVEQASTPEDAVGGPFIEADGPEYFDASLDGLDSALNRLETMRDTARRLPFANPAPGHDVTSRFGTRTDPFLGRLALHSGMDFRFQPGASIRSTGAGKVTLADFTGGYGNMVEVDHGNGLSTRYGHMSRILVKAGDEIEAGDTVGLAGSTGRSTGTHLHYEVRRNGKAVDPSTFLNAGDELLAYMQ